jgi:DNA polymerase III gamma/tau subunit
VRDAVALLDQLATFGSGRIADEDAARILGGVGATVHFRLLSSIIEGLSQEVAAVVSEIEEEGWDPRHVFGEFLSYCRDALHLALGAEPADIELPEDDAEQLAGKAKEAGYENLLRLLHQLLGSESTVRRSEAGTLAVEIAWLRAAELPKLTRIEEVLAQGSPPPSASSRTTKKSPAPRQRSSPPPPKKVVENVEPQPPEPEVEKTAIAADSRIQEFLVEVSRRRQPLAAHLQESLRLIFEDGQLSIYTAPEDQWLATALARGKNRRILEESLAVIWGEGTKWRLQERRDLGPPADSEVGAVDDDEILKHPFVQTALDIFGGTARAIKSDDSKEMP